MAQKKAADQTVCRLFVLFAPIASLYTRPRFVFRSEQPAWSHLDTAAIHKTD